jgi:hypothetical protein
MRDITRINIIMENLTKLWLKYPDMRLGQLLENFIFPSIMVGKGIDARIYPQIWNQEDYETLLKIKEKLMF